MATTCYFRHNSASDGTRVPNIHRGTNTAKLNGSTSGWGALALDTVRGVSTTALILSANTVNGPTSGVEIVQNLLPVEWISGPIDQDVTISGTITFNIWSSESNMSANVAINCTIDRLDSQGAIASTIVTTARVVELGTSSAVANFTATPTSTNMLKGDRFRVRVFGDDATGVNMATGFTFSMTLGRDTAAVDGDSWIQFTENFAFQTTDPAGTQLFLTDVAGPAVGANIEKEMWTSRGDGVNTAVVNTAAGWTAPIQFTSTAGGTAIEWYTRALTAFTLSGLVKVNLRVHESNVSANAGVRAELAVCDNDGANATIWGASSIISLPSPTGAWSPDEGTDSVGEVTTTQDDVSLWLAGDDTAVADNKRLRLRVFIDDTATVAMATAFTATLSYDGTSGGATGDSYITLPQSVTEYIPATPRPIVAPSQAVHRSFNW